VRRSTGRWPTEYKLQYSWKAPEASAPLLQAQEALDHHHHHHDHHPACSKKPGNQDDQDSQDDPGDSVRSIDGSYDSDQKRHVPVVAEPTRKRATSAITKHRKTSKQETATNQASKQLVQVPTLNITKAKRTAPIKTRNRPKLPSTQTQHEEEQKAGSESDTDSQTGQKPQNRSTSTHCKCGHKKKRKAKRKLIWPMTTEYQTQFKLREKPSVFNDENDQVRIK